MGMVLRRLLQGSLLGVDIMRVLGRIILCREGRECLVRGHGRILKDIPSASYRERTFAYR
jgi:hypothetical protein